MAPERVSHYELVRLIGRGGMGEVHEATDLTLRRRVALKFLSPELASDAAALERFEREAHSAADLSHPHIATVHAFDSDGDRPFIAMELLAGPSLRELVNAGVIPVARALGITRDVAAALAYAHRRGIAHRDIKPENLMFDEHGTVKVMDFGLARATMASKLTLTGTSLGTPAYMSPEAIRGQASLEGDVFALGLIAWEMLAGRRAYAGDNVMAVMFAIANEEPAALRGLRPDVPEAFETLIARMLVKDPAARIDAAAVATELAAMTGSPPPVLQSGAGAPVVRAAGTARRRMALIATLLAIAVGIASLLVWNNVSARRREAAVRLQEQGVEAKNAGRLDEARARFTAALKLNPSQAGSLTSLGLMALREQRYASAESLFDAVLRHAGNDTTVRAATLQNLAECDMARGVYGRAVTRLEGAFELDSSYAEVYNSLGWALIQNRQTDDALRLLRRGIARFRGEPFLFKNAGLASHEAGDLQGALGFLDEALRLDPTLKEAEDLRERTRREIAAAGR